MEKLWVLLFIMCHFLIFKYTDWFYRILEAPQKDFFKMFLDPFEKINLPSIPKKTNCLTVILLLLIMKTEVLSFFDHKNWLLI